MVEAKLASSLRHCRDRSHRGRGHRYRHLGRPNFDSSYTLHNGRLMVEQVTASALAGPKGLPFLLLQITGSPKVVVRAIRNEHLLRRFLVFAVQFVLGLLFCQRVTFHTVSFLAMCEQRSHLNQIIGV